MHLSYMTHRSVRVSFQPMIDLEQVLGKERRGNRVIVYNNDEIDFRPFAFVLNVKELVNKDSVAIAPGYILRKAHKAEIDFIKEFLKENGTRYSTGMLRSVMLW